jgi:phosphoesterase RecJ-like protein
MVLFKEAREGGFKVSLRSSGFPVNKVAALFDGGGHRQAAGCTIEGDYDSVRRKLFDALDKVRESLEKE